MCRLGPIVAKACPVIKDEGLPREGGRVNIPALGTLGIHTGNSGKERGQPVPETKCAQENVYNVLRDAGLDPPVQRGTVFEQLLDVSAAQPAEGMLGVQFADLAKARLRELRRKGRYSVELVEVVAVINARVTALAAVLEADRDAGQEVAQYGGGLLADVTAAISMLTAYRDFSSNVLATAVGSTTGQIPALPDFYRELPQPRPGEDVTSDAVILAYAEVGAFVSLFVVKC